MSALDAETIRRGDPTGQAQDITDLAAHLRDALWRVESAAIKPLDAPGGLIVAGMGGSAIGGQTGAGGARPAGAAPDRRGARLHLPPWAGADTLVLCASYSGATEETLRRLRRRRRARRHPHRRDHRRRAGGPRPGRQGAGDPAARRLPAARGRRLLVRDRCRGCGALRRRPIAGGRDRERRDAGRTARRRLGPRRRRGLDRQGPGPPPARLRAGDRRRRADRAGRLPVEDAAQRERQAARVRGGAARARPQRDRRLARLCPNTASSPPCSSTTTTRTRARGGASS